MAVLSDTDRAELWAEFMRSPQHMFNGAGSITKAQLRAAIDAADDWADANASAYNTAIPQPARSALSSKQKAAILMFVIDRRWTVL